MSKNPCAQIFGAIRATCGVRQRILQFLLNDTCRWFWPKRHYVYIKKNEFYFLSYSHYFRNGALCNIMSYTLILLLILPLWYAIFLLKIMVVIYVIMGTPWSKVCIITVGVINLFCRWEQLYCNAVVMIISHNTFVYIIGQCCALYNISVCISVSTIILC